MAWKIVKIDRVIESRVNPSIAEDESMTDREFQRVQLFDENNRSPCDRVYLGTYT